MVFPPYSWVSDAISGVEEKEELSFSCAAPVLFVLLFRVIPVKELRMNIGNYPAIL